MLSEAINTATVLSVLILFAVGGLVSLWLTFVLIRDIGVYVRIWDKFPAYNAGMIFLHIVGAGFFFYVGVVLLYLFTHWTGF